MLNWGENILLLNSQKCQITILSSQIAGVWVHVSKNKALKLYEEKSSPRLS